MRIIRCYSEIYYVTVEDFEGDTIFTGIIEGSIHSIKNYLRDSYSCSGFYYEISKVRADDDAICDCGTFDEI